MKTLPSAIVASLVLFAATAPAQVQSQTATQTQTKTTTTLKPGTVLATTMPVPIEKARAHTFKMSAGTEQLAASKVVIPAGATSAIDVPEKKLDANWFSQTVHTKLKDKVRGYAMQLRKVDQVVISQAWGYARASQDGNKAFDVTTQMHVASVSKVITAMATVKLLEEKGISWDAAIGPYLPLYWNVSSEVANVTFRELMTHKSGFTGYDDRYDFPLVKNVAALTIKWPHQSTSTYANLNFSFLRVVDSVASGLVARNNVWAEDINDALWDLGTMQAFSSYVQAKVFVPSGVAAVVTRSTPTSAIAYQNTTDATGWDSGDVAPAIGTAGFRLSVKELLDVMGTFRRKGTIVSPTKAKQALDAKLGIDNIWDTSAGRVYAKNGQWRDTNGHHENSVVLFLPGGYECAVLVNSNMGSTDLRDAIVDAYLLSLSK